MTPLPQRGLPLGAVVRWLIVTLTKMAAQKDWGEIKITVQGGQVVYTQHLVSYRDHLPVDAEAAQLVQDQKLRNLAAVS